MEYSSENWFSLGKISLWTRAIECFTIPGRFGLEKRRLGHTRASRKNLAFQLAAQHRVGLLSPFQQQGTRCTDFRRSVPPPFTVQLKPTSHFPAHQQHLRGTRSLRAT